MNSTPRVLISILNYNDSSDVIETIESFYKQSYANCHIQLIDNNSSNNCVELIKVKFPELKIIVLDKNLGYAGGNNFAFESCIKEKFDYILISNNDIFVENDLVYNLVQTSIKNPKAGVIGIIEKDYYSEKIRAVGGYGFKFIKGKGFWLESIQKIKTETIEADYVQGALVMFSKKVLNKGLRFDEKLFMYCEEVDMQFPLKKIGLKAIVSLKNYVRHKGVPEKLNLLQGYYIQRNRLYLTKKHGTHFQFLVSIFYYLFFEIPAKIFLRSIQGNFNYAIACIFGFIDGLRNRMYKCDIEYLNNRSQSVH